MDAIPNVAGLQDFAQSDDRGLSPIFAGREEEMELLSRHALRLFEDWKMGRDVSGRTRVVVGCPGMGKTSLLRRFAETRCNRPRERSAPLAVSVSIHDLKDEGGIARAISETARDDARTANVLRALAGDLARRLGAGSTLDALVDAYRESRAEAHPVVLLVDETQNADPKANAAVLAKLHEGSIRLPILPVFAGLNDTPDTLRRCGISRLSRQAVVDLQRLSDEESRLAVRELFVKHQVGGAQAVREQWIEQVATASLGFPQHLHAGMGEAARVLAHCRGEATPEGLSKALERGGQARQAYYRDRISDAIDDHGEMLVDLVRHLEGSNHPLRRADAKRFVCRAFETQRLSASKALEKADFFVDRLLHDGILQQSLDGSGLVVPIPSMQAWLTGEYARSIGAGGWQRASG